MTAKVLEHPVSHYTETDLLLFGNAVFLKIVIQAPDLSAQVLSQEILTNHTRQLGLLLRIHFLLVLLAQSSELAWPAVRICGTLILWSVILVHES